MINEDGKTECVFISSKGVRSEKMCSLCGDMVKIYAVWKNSCICRECCPKLNIVEIKEAPKKKIIPSEAGMLDKILEKSK